MFGKGTALTLPLIAQLGCGQLLFEDAPECGKTVLVCGLAQLIGGEFRRLQFTLSAVPQYCQA